MRKLKAAIANFALLLSAVVIAVLIAEILLRVFMPEQLPVIGADIWMPKPELGYEKYPNLDTISNAGEGAVRILTDHKGYRIGVAGSEAASRRILALGDSFLEALAVEYQQTMTGRLEEMIAEKFGFLVNAVNTGVAGWNPNHYLIKARKELESENYDLVIVFLFMGNDIINKRRAWIEPKKHELRQMHWPQGFSYREFVDALIYPLYQKLRTKSHLVIFAKRRVSRLLARLGFSSRPFPATLIRSESQSPRWDITGSVCQDIAREATEHDTSAIFVLLPPDFQVDTGLGTAYAIGSGIDPKAMDLNQSSHLLADQFEDRGLEFIDMTPEFRKAHGAGKTVYAKVDRHLSILGHNLVAQRLIRPVMEHLKRDNNVANQ